MFGICECVSKILFVMIIMILKIYFFPTGNKSDLENLREVSPSSAKDLAQHYEMMDFVETSAKENDNVDEAFLRMAKVSMSIGSIFHNKSRTKKLISDNRYRGLLRSGDRNTYLDMKCDLVSAASSYSKVIRLSPSL